MPDLDRRIIPERRSVHEDCIVHSGVQVRLNLVLWLLGGSTIILGTLLMLMIDVHAYSKSNATALSKLEAAVFENDRRIKHLERIVDRNHNMESYHYESK